MAGTLLEIPSIPPGSLDPQGNITVVIKSPETYVSVNVLRGGVASKDVNHGGSEQDTLHCIRVSFHIDAQTAGDLGKGSLLVCLIIKVVCKLAGVSERAPY